MPYEKFDPQKLGFSSRRALDYVKVSNRGIRIGKGYTDNHFEGSQYVEMYYDPDKATIGIKPLFEKTPCNLKIYKSKSGSSWIGAKDFIAHYKVPFKSNTRYISTWNDDLKLLEVSL